MARVSTVVAVEGLLADRAQEHGLLGHGGQGGGGGQGVDEAGHAQAGRPFDVAGDPGHELAPDLVQDLAQLGVLDRRLEGDQVGIAVVQVGQAGEDLDKAVPDVARDAGAGRPGRPGWRRSRRRGRPARPACS